MDNLGFQEILLIAACFGLLIIPGIFFMLTLQKTLETIEPQNRTIKPGKVWLLFIPLFNVVWAFILVKAIADSCQNQLEQYGVFNQQKPTYSIGMAWAICTVCNWIPIVGVFAGFGFAGFICRLLGTGKRCKKANADVAANLCRQGRNLYFLICLHHFA